MTNAGIIVQSEQLNEKYVKQKTVEEVVSLVLGIEEELIHDELEYRSIWQWDSLGHINILLALEEEYNLQIDESVRDQLTSIKAIKRYIKVSTNKGFESNNNDDQDEALSLKSSNERVYRGLANVTLDSTTITCIDGKEGKLFYRGISIEELVKYSTFEETAYLLLFGGLPTKQELSSFTEKLKMYAELPKELHKIIYLLKDSHPIDLLRTSISSLEGLDNNLTNDFYNRAIKILALTPQIVAVQHAYRQNREPVAPRKELSYAANFLYMLSGKVPSKEEERILDRVLILHADHGSNASAFAARVAAGTKTDIYGSLTSAIATFSGELHGGAIEEVMTMVNEIGNPTAVREYVKKKLKSGESIMGFGHRVYKTEDPRAKFLKEMAKEISIKKGLHYYKILESLVETMAPYREKGMDVNVDFYASIVYHALGIPKDLFISLFASGRMVGWLAQMKEQYDNNILIRPQLTYVGNIDEYYIPIEERSNN